MLQLNREGNRNCVPVASPNPPNPVDGWKESVLRADMLDDGVITAMIGPSAGDKGYKAITGRT